MVVMRPVKTQDLQALMELATLSGFGLTTLPRDAELLRKRIVKSQRSFEQLGDQPGPEDYLLVMEDLETGRVLGTSGMLSKVGGFDPFYTYRIETSVHESAFLGVRKEIRALHLVAEHSGPSEVCSLFLVPHARKDDNGRLLSLSRFLFMAEHRAAFDATVIAEIRGVIDEKGRSAFWDAIGKHFFEIEFPKADYLSLINKRFIADLMPKHPIYAPLLPREAQDVIGQPHPQSLPAMKLLESEGFRFTGMIDIFEGGPVVSCALDQVRTIRSSRRAKVKSIAARPIEGRTVLISNTKVDFRGAKAQLAPLDFDDPHSEIELHVSVAQALQVSVGDWVRFAPLRGTFAPPPPEAQQE